MYFPRFPFLGEAPMTATDRGAKKGRKSNFVSLISGLERSRVSLTRISLIVLLPVSIDVTLNLRDNVVAPVLEQTGDGTVFAAPDIFLPAGVYAAV